MTVESWLQQLLKTEGAVAGTVHRRENDELVLVASHNIPAAVLQKTQIIPRGKGMAGLAWERDQIVQTCDLKTDQSGDVRPGAKAVNAQGAAAIPVHDVSGALRAVVGIAFATQRDFTPDELVRLARAAEALPADD